MTSRTTALGLILLLAEWAACTEKTPCDQNQELGDNGYCYPVKDASVASTGPGEAGTNIDPFGRTCTSAGDCAKPASICTGENGAAGFCSAVGCDTNPSICPAGWGCMDLAARGYPAHLCVPPTSEEATP